MELIQDLNKRLIEYYSLDVSTGTPTWRIVWSNSQLESRFGTFIKETESGVYLGEWTGVRQVPKYPMNPDSWILEKLYPNVNNPELHDKYSYEPIWIFKQGQQPIWQAIEYIIRQWERATSSKSTQKDADYSQSLAKEKLEMYEHLKSEGEAFHGKLHDHEGIVVPSNFVPNSGK